MSDKGEFKKRVSQISEWLKVDLSVHPTSPIAEALLFKEKEYFEMLDEAHKDIFAYIEYADKTEDGQITEQSWRITDYWRLMQVLLKWFGCIEK